MSASNEEIKTMLNEQVSSPGDALTRTARLLEFVAAVHPIYTENEKFKHHCNQYKLSKLDKNVIEGTKELSKLIDFIRPSFKPPTPKL